MPTFRPFDFPQGGVRIDPVGAFVRGQAQKMAFERSKYQSQVLKEQAADLAYKNTPQYRQQQRADEQQNRDYKQALIDQMGREPTPKLHEGVGPQGKPGFFKQGQGGMERVPGASPPPAVPKAGGSPSSGTKQEAQMVTDIIANDPSFDGLGEEDLYEIEARILSNAKAIQKKTPGLSFSDAIDQAKSAEAGKVSRTKGRFWGENVDYNKPSAPKSNPNDPLGLFTDEAN